MTSEQPVAPSHTLGDIERLCKEYEETSANLEAALGELESDLAAVRSKHIAALKRHAGIVARREAELLSAIEASSNLFKKPRTLTLHGVKIGFATNTVGRLVFEDADAVVKLIEKHFGKDAQSYISTKPEPDKDALKTLDAADLKKLGCHIEGVGDVVVCRRVAGDIEKLMNTLTRKLAEAMVEAK